MAQRLTSIAERAFEPCAHDRAFHFSNGAAAHTLPEFLQHLRGVDLGTLEYHRHHFHFWLHDVMGDKTLSARVRMLGERGDLRGEDLREALATTVDERLAALENETGKKASRATAGARGKGPRNVPVRRRG